MKKLSFLILIVTVCFAAGCKCNQTLESKKEAMIKRQIIFRGITDERILNALREVPREKFVLPQYQNKAYDDLEVPIGNGETLDRPYEDALILKALNIKPTDKVLEVGTGSGYLAALMSKLASKVYTIEIAESLGIRAKQILTEQGYDNVEALIGDGFVGLQEHAPFDAIVLTCSPSKVPEPLKTQLAEGGRLLLPLGGEERFQELLLYTKKNGKFILDRRVAPAEFVPMKGMVKEK